MNGYKARSKKAEDALREECIKYNALDYYNNNLPKPNENATQTDTRRRRIRKELKRCKDQIERSTVVLEQQKVESARLTKEHLAKISLHDDETIPSSPPRSPPKKKINNNTSSSKNDNNNIHAPADYAPTGNHALSAADATTTGNNEINDATLTDAPTTSTQPSTWKTDEYVSITNNARNCLHDIDEVGVSINSEIKEKLRDAAPMRFNAAVLEALKGTGTLEVPSIDPNKFLMNNLRPPQFNTSKNDTDLASCDIHQIQFSRRKDTRENFVAKRTVTINIHTNTDKIAATLIPVNDLQSKAQSSMEKNVLKMGYKVESKEANFGKRSVYCDAEKLTRDHLVGLWRCLDENQQVVYLDSKGNLPLSMKMTRNWNNGGVGVMYVLVSNYVDMNSIKQAISTTSKYNINHLPLAILFLIREVQQNGVAIKKRKEREDKMNKIYNHDESVATID